MADLAMHEASPWAGLARPGRFGTSAGDPGVVLAEASPGAAVLLGAAKGKGAGLVADARTLGISLPTTPKWARTGATLLVWAGPGQWLARAAGTAEALQGELAPLLAYAVAIDQSHARAFLTVSGRRARDALAKGMDIDLHPRAFQPGDVALTLAAQVPAMLMQLDDGPTFEIAVPRSFAGSVWHWLAVSAAEYGYQVAEPNGASTHGIGVG